MTTYYDAILLLSCASLFVLMVLIHENGRMKADTKKRLYLSYGMLVLAMIMERLAIFLNGAPAWTLGIHTLVKCLDYILTPMVGMMFVRQISREGKPINFMWGVLAINTAIQIASFFTGWTYYVDQNNIYHHGPWYFIYILVYIIIILLVILQFYLYGQRFKKRNRLSLYLIVLLANAGIIVQETVDIRLSYLSLTMASILLFIHNNEFNQQKNDDVVLWQQKLLSTDELTGLESRYAYNIKLTELNEMDHLPEDTIVFMLDINGLKAVNDSLGHVAGDELISGMASCVLETFSPHGKCYRTGGDEFVAIIQAEEEKIEDLCRQLMQKVGSWKGRLTDNASLSYGYVSAAEHPECSIEQLIKAADDRMYEEKARYYSSGGRDRRKR